MEEFLIKSYVSFFYSLLTDKPIELIPALTTAISILIIFIAGILIGIAYSGIKLSNHKISMYEQARANEVRSRKTKGSVAGVD